MKKKIVLLSTMLSVLMLSSNLVVKANYTTDDLNRLTDYLHNKVSVSEEDFNYFDINKDSNVNIYDMTLMKRELYWEYGDIVDTGQLSNNNYWNLRPLLRQDGFCLEICGNGELSDYKSLSDFYKADYINSPVLSNYLLDIPFIKINNGITSIGDYNFNNIQASRIDIPDTVTAIGKYSFMYSQPYSIVLPDSVTTVGIWAFCNNDNATNIILSNNLKSLNYFSFAGLHAAKRIYIPSSVTSINSKAFSTYDLDRNNTEFWYEGSEEQWNLICPSTLSKYVVHCNAVKGDWLTDKVSILNR